MRENGRVAGRGRPFKDRPRGAGRDRGPRGARERRREGERRARGRAQEGKRGEDAEALCCSPHSALSSFTPVSHPIPSRLKAER